MQWSAIYFLGEYGNRWRVSGVGPRIGAGTISIGDSLDREVHAGMNCDARKALHS